MPAEPLARFRCSLAEYFDFEAAAAEKHEYRDGEVVAMAGGSSTHSLIIVNVASECRSRLRGTSCLVYDSNLRVSVPRDVRYVYPDVSVICGPVAYDPGDHRRHTAINPRVIVEVSSPSTEAYDRGDKYRRYIRISTLEEYVIVSQSAPVIETITRQPDGAWGIRGYEGLDAVARLRSLNIDLPLAEVYAGVEFSSPSDAAAGAPMDAGRGSPAT